MEDQTWKWPWDFPKGTYAQPTSRLYSNAPIDPVKEIVASTRGQEFWLALLRSLRYTAKVANLV
jgi:hypothetical protein